MILFPAIDLLDKKVVRLLQGRYDQVTEYSQDPMKMAEHWKSQGATWLHLVDLNGAKTGTMANIQIIEEIIKKIGISVQVGGGVRSLEIIQELLDKGVGRVVLATKALEDPTFLEQILKKWPDKIMVSLDCVKQQVMKDGWLVSSDFTADRFLKYLEESGLKYLVYTDVGNDGTLVGVNWEMVKWMLNDTEHLNIIVAGGVANIEDIKGLAQLSLLHQGRLFGAITGKAIYEGKLDFKKALEAITYA
jgi:phosphoribosylformimino-5-aminoimidazole carboxamide ribotide isomerase